MPALVHNYGLELPVFDEATPIAWTTDEIEDAAKAAESTTFVRRTILEDVGRSINLKHALDLADLVLSRTAEHFEAELLDHTWGLYKGYYADSPEVITFSSHSVHLIPQGYSLVAEVPILRQAHALDATQKATIFDKRFTYQATMGASTTPYTLRDLSSAHFVSTRERDNQRLTLVDIDPREQVIR